MSKIMFGQFVWSEGGPYLMSETLMSLLLLLTTLFILKKAGISFGKRRLKGGLNGIRGPSGLPFIGIGHTLPKAREAHKFVLEMVQKYGSTWKAIIFNHQFVFLGNAAHVQRLLSSKEVGHLKRSQLVLDLMFGKFLKAGILRSTDINGEWKEHRKILNGAFTFKSLQSYVPLINKCSRELTSDLHSLFDGGKAMEFHPIEEQIHYCGIAVISEVVFGLNSTEKRSEAAAFYDNIKKAKDLTSERQTQPWLLINSIWRLHPKSRQFDEALGTVNLIIKRMIAENSEQVDNDDRGITFKHMMGLMQKEGLGENEILEEVKTMIVAGFETSSALVHFALFMLALNPEYQALCHQEIDSIFTSPNLSSEGSITFEGLQEMKYTERCLHETLRLYPPVHTYDRKLETPLQLDAAVEIPAGTTVLVSAALLHRNPEFFPKPEVFDPDRFLPENCAKRHPYAWTPFGGGRRICIGWKLGMLEAKCMVGHILRHFELRTTDNPENVAVVPGPILAPERGYLFHLKKRDHAPPL